MVFTVILVSYVLTVISINVEFVPEVSSATWMMMDDGR